MSWMIRCQAMLLLLILAAPVQATPIQQATLNNGLRVLLMESHNLPMVAMQLQLPAGSRFDAPGKAGTAAMLAAMLTDHSARHAHDAFSLWLDEQAIQLGAGAGKDTLSLSLTVLREALPQGLDALSEALLQPGWNKKRFAQLQKDAVAAATKSLEEPGYRASLARGKLLYGTHPYASPSAGDANTLAKISVQDIRQLYRQQCRPEGAVLAVSGDITMDTLLPMLNQRWQSWQGKPAVAADHIAKVRPQAVTQQDITMPTTQTLVQFARLGIARHDPDFFPVLVLNHYLGGSGFGSLLMEEVREKRGLVYGVYSYAMPLLATGPLVISLQTRADQAAAAEKLVRQQLDTLARGHVDAQRLKKIKGNLTGGFAQRMDSNRERVGLIGMIGFYHLPLDYLENWTKRVDSVKLADVQRVAKRFMPADEWSVIRVGPGGKKP